MAQHDHVLDNAAGAAFRADLNLAIAAIVSRNSGTTAPTTTYALMWWADTTTNILKIRNLTNTGWISIFNLSTGKALNMSVDGTTIEISGNALQIVTNSIGTSYIVNDSVDKDKIAADVAGNGLAQNVDGSLEVTVDDVTLEIVTDTLQVKALTLNLFPDYTSGTGYGALGLGGLTPGATRSANYVKCLEYTVPVGGTLKTYLRVRGNNTGAPAAVLGYARIYVNGVATGTERSQSDSVWSSWYAEDIAVSAGDELQIYCKEQDANYPGSFAFFATSGVSTLSAVPRGVT